MSPSPRIRFEWISLVYLALFALAVLSPSLVTRDFVWLDERHVEELLIFCFGIVGLTTFSVYQRLMERQEKEHADAKNEYERAKRELVESYQYIGSVNRQIEVLKGIANQTSLSLVESGKIAKDLLSKLAENAAASANARVALIRYIDLEKRRTGREVLHVLEGSGGLKVSNKEMVKVHASGAAHAYIRSEDGQELLVVPSDHQDVSIKAFLLVIVDPSRGPEIDTSLLKVFANQAELIYHALEKSTRKPDAMELVKEAKDRAVGEVG